MAEGSDTYNGLGVPLSGESEIKQVPGDEAIDILTLTGSTGTQTGDFLVAQSGAGTEVFVVSSSGLITSAVGVSATSITGLSKVGLTLSSTALDGVSIAVTSTGAIADGSITNNAIYVYGSSKSNLNAVLGYNGLSGDGTSACNYLLAVYGSKAPTYFMAVGATTVATGAELTNGYFKGSLRANSTVLWGATAAGTNQFYGVACLAGSKVFYLIGVSSTLVTVA